MDEQQLLGSRELYEEVFANTSDLIQFTDLEGRLTTANDAWLLRLGYRKAQLPGLTMGDVLAPEYHDQFKRIFRCEDSETSHRVRGEFVTRNGARLWVDGKVTYRFVDGRAVGTHAIFRDVTAHERLLDMKAEFIAMVNHELRTPLTSIAGSLSLLRNGKESLSEKSRGFLDIVARNTDRLISLVSAILDAEQLSDGKLEVTEVAVDVEQLLVEVAEAHRGLAAPAHVAIDVAPLPEPLSIVTDPQRLRQIIAHFVTNAIRHSDRGDAITLTARAGERFVRLSVADQGSGIPIEFRPTVFESFMKGAGARSGSGLGLAIAQGLARRLGGEVGFWSVSGEGTAFWAELPAETEARPATIDAHSFQCVPDLVAALGAEPHATLRLDCAVGPLSPRILLEELAACTLPQRLAVAVDDTTLHDDFADVFAPSSGVIHHDR